MLDRVRGVDGVAEAVGRVSGYAELVVDGEPVESGGAPSIGVDMQPGSRARDADLRAGRAPDGRGEVAIDEATAEREGIAVGDRVQVAHGGGRPRRHRGRHRRVRRRRQLRRRRADGVRRAATAQDALGPPGTYPEIAVAAEEGVDDAELAERIGAVLPEAVEAVTAEQSSAETSAEIKEGLGFFTTALLVFAGISLFVGAFLIFNTFSMLVAQRARELALLRALGASRRQVTRSVLVEALVVGLLASLVGFGLGIAVAIGLRGAARRCSASTCPTASSSSRRAPSSCASSSASASRPWPRWCRPAGPPASPRSRPCATPGPPRSARCAAAASPAACCCRRDRRAGRRAREGSLPLVGLGAAVTFLGVATLSPLVARPVASVLAAPFARLGVPGRLGRANAVRSPRRTSATAAALMVGLALVSAVSVLGASLKASVGDVVDRSFGADFVLTSSSFQGFSPTVADALREAPEIGAVLAVRSAELQVRDVHRRRHRHRPRAAVLEVLQPRRGRGRPGVARRAAGSRPDDVAPRWAWQSATGCP